MCQVHRHEKDEAFLFSDVFSLSETKYSLTEECASCTTLHDVVQLQISRSCWDKVTSLLVQMRRTSEERGSLTTAATSSSVNGRKENASDRSIDRALSVSFSGISVNVCLYVSSNVAGILCKASMIGSSSLQSDSFSSCKAAQRNPLVEL